MSFSKENLRVFVMSAFSVFLIVQGVVMQCSRSYRTQIEEMGSNESGMLALDEVNQLQKAWRKAAVDDLITPEKMADQRELQLARARLKEAEIEIQNFKRSIQGGKGRRREFFDKVYAYYNHSALGLLAIVDFLLAKQGEYSVYGNEINFNSETDGETLSLLINQLSDIYQEKQELDAFILQNNKKLSSR